MTTIVIHSEKLEVYILPAKLWLHLAQTSKYFPFHDWISQSLCTQHIPNDDLVKILCCSELKTK